MKAADFLRSFQGTYERLLGPDALSGAQGLAEALARAEPEALNALDAELQKGGVAQWLQAQPTIGEMPDTVAQDDEPLNLSALEIARGEDYLASMMTASGIAASDWYAPEPDIADVTDVKVKIHSSSDDDHATVMLEVDVPRESVDAWRSVRQIRRLEVDDDAAPLGAAEG